MTAPRQGAKRVLPLLAAIFIGFPVRAEPPLVVNPDTGLALSGFDPVAYFTEGKPELGRPEWEARLEGAVWRFRNVGNRAAFMSHAAAYQPAYGGYDPVAIGRERSVPGHPLYWAIRGKRLYLFYSAENRATFLAEPARTLFAAERKWPQVEKTIGR